MSPSLRASLPITPSGVGQSTQATIRGSIHSDTWRTPIPTLPGYLSALSTYKFSFHPAGVVFRPGRWKSYISPNIEISPNYLPTSQPFPILRGLEDGEPWYVALTKPLTLIIICTFPRYVHCIRTYFQSNSTSNTFWHTSQALNASFINTQAMLSMC